MANDVLTVAVPDARHRFEQWITQRGGVARWGNVNLSDPGAGDIYTPLRDIHGTENINRPPHWTHRYVETITDISRFRFVREMKEVDRFRVAVRMGRQGFSMKLTDASSAKVKKHEAKMEEKYAKPAYYHFDYETQECIITIPIFEDEPVAVES